jgi:hypothetical protein
VLAPASQEPTRLASSAPPRTRTKAWVIRITGTDLGAIPRYRLGAKTDKVVEAV